MQKASIAKILLVEIILITGLLMFVYKASSQELPLYPPESQENLDHFDYGVEKTISVKSAGVEFTYTNSYNSNKTITTSGSLILDQDLDVLSVNVDYYITNSDKRIVRIVNLISSESGENSYTFERTFPFSGNYELCTFHLNVVDQEIMQEEFELEGEKLNV